MRKFLVAVLMMTSSAAMAQDLVAVAADNAKVEFENEKVRVVRLKMGPHETLPPHDRPARVVIALSANDVRITGPDGKPRMLHVPAGNIGWGEPTHGRSVETLDSGFENVIVEIKGAKAPAQQVTHPPDANDAGALIEPDHHWLFENQYVRVYDVRIPPGATTNFHRHALDCVPVFVSGGSVADQRYGQPWGKTQKIEPSSVSFSADSTRPYTHHVRNEGAAEWRVVLVQLK